MLGAEQPQTKLAWAPGMRELPMGETKNDSPLKLIIRQKQDRQKQDRRTGCRREAVSLSGQKTADGLLEGNAVERVQQP
jgi:hypothetical protein